MKSIVKVAIAALAILAPVASFAQSVPPVPTVAGIKGYNIPAAQLAPALAGTSQNTLAAGNDSRITGAIQSVARLTGTPTIQALNHNLSTINRAPTATDDSSAGNSVGDLWLYNNRVWQAQNVTVGHASWTPLVLGGNTLPGDLNIVPTNGLYGTVKLSASYTGNDLILTRGSDSTTQTVGFVGNNVDAATADAFCSKNGDLAARTCYVTTLYDQGASGCTAAQTILADSPIWTENQVNGHRVITFNSIESGAAPVSKWLNITACSYIPNRTSVVVAAQARSSRQTNSFFDLGANVSSYMSASYNIGVGMAINAGISTSVIGQSGPAISVFNEWANTAQFYSNNDTGPTISTSTGATAQTTATIGVNMANGSTSSFGPADNDLVAMEVTANTAAFTSAQMSLLRASFALLSGIAPQQPDTVWIADGDSITNGYQSTALRGYPPNSLPAVAYPVKLYNMGVSGITVATKITQLATTYNAGVLAACRAARSCIISILLGTNDINDSATASGIFANLQSYAASIKALLPNAKIVAISLTPRTDLDATATAILVALQGLIQSGWQSYASALIDFASDPIMGPASAPNNTALYVDELHPTDYGYAILGDDAAAVIGSLIQ